MMSSLSLYFVSFLVFQQIQFVFGGGGGLNNGSFLIKLIHRDSVESPLYPGNLTLEERVSRLHQQAKAHEMQMLWAKEAEAKTQKKRMQTNTTIGTEQIQSQVLFNGYYYLASVGIGTFDNQLGYMPYWLMIDTGSDLIWTQCEDCNPCFEQDRPFYPFKTSTTFTHIRCRDYPGCGPDHCDPYNGIQLCTFYEEYINGQLTEGLLAKDRFTFQSSLPEQRTEAVTNIVFGCGMAQEDFNFGTVPGKVNQIAGIIGLGLGRRSLIRQLGERVQNRFSHCLQPWFHGKVPSTDLVFGSDAVFRDGQQVSTLPLINHSLHYYLKLEDISIFGEKLRHTFPPEASSFDIRQDGSGGCFIDIGSPFTSIQHPIYEHVIFPLAAYFSTYELFDRNPDYHYCFKRKPEGNLPFPSMILHFANGVDMEIGPDDLIMDLNEYFCIAIRPQLEPRAPTITIGNSWQANYRFVYDLNAMTLSFAKENCDHFGQ